MPVALDRLTPDVLDPLLAHVRALATGSYPAWVERMHRTGGADMGVAEWSVVGVNRLVHTAMDSACAALGGGLPASRALLAMAAVLVLDTNPRGDLALKLGDHWLLVEIVGPRSPAQVHWAAQGQPVMEATVDPEAIHRLLGQAQDLFSRRFSLYGPILMTAGVVLLWEELRAIDARSYTIERAARTGKPPYRLTVYRQPQAEPITLLA